jgi:hypothetical protein
MSSSAVNYPSPTDGHSQIGSPVPSQMLLHRVSSPNHLTQHSYVESPRSVPAEFSHPYSNQTEQSFEYAHIPEEYAAEDPHIYDFSPNGLLPTDPHFVQSQSPHPSSAEAANLLFVVRTMPHFSANLAATTSPSNPSTYSNASIRKQHVSC